MSSTAGDRWVFVGLVASTVKYRSFCISLFAAANMADATHDNLHIVSSVWLHNAPMIMHLTLEILIHGM